MPLIKSKSKEAFEKNVSKEMESGKPQKQSIAIAYNVQKHAKKKKKMAFGGEAEADGNPGTPKAKPDDRRLDPKDYMSTDKWAGGPDPERKPDDKRLPEDEYMADQFDKADPAQKPMKTPPGENQRERNSSSYSATDDKYAEGGPVQNKKGTEQTFEDYADETHTSHPDPEQYAKGGKVMNPKLSESKKSPDTEDAEEHYSSIADAILAKKKKAKMFAEGGEVEDESLMGDSDSPEGHSDIFDNAQEEPNRYYRRNEDEVLKENYDSDFMDSKQPEDSNEHGDSIDSDDHDMVEAIRKKMKYKQNLG